MSHLAIPTGPGLVVAETAMSVWNYHLRELGEGEQAQLSGAPNLRALCGYPLGWDTQISLDAYGHKSHIPTRWCVPCWDEARRRGHRGVSDPRGLEKR